MQIQVREVHPDPAVAGKEVAGECFTFNIEDVLHHSPDTVPQSTSTMAAPPTEAESKWAAHDAVQARQMQKRALMPELASEQSGTSESTSASERELNMLRKRLNKGVRF